LSKQIEQIPATMQADIVRASLESDNPFPKVKLMIRAEKRRGVQCEYSERYC